MPSQSLWFQTDLIQGVETSPISTDSNQLNLVQSTSSSQPHPVNFIQSTSSSQPHPVNLIQSTALSQPHPSTSPSQPNLANLT